MVTVVTNEEEREFLMQIRKARLIEVAAIERRYPSRMVTVVIRREEAERLGLLKSPQNVTNT